MKITKITDDEKLEILLSAYSGPAKETLSGYLQFEDPITGYEAAWDVLDKRHGDKYDYIDQLKKKVLVGPTVQISDPKGIKQLSDDLECCVRNMSSLGELREIDSYGSVSAIAERFKGSLWDDYTEKKHRYCSKQNGRPPRIEWLLGFVKDRARKAEILSKEQGQKERGKTNVSAPSSKAPTVKEHVSLLTMDNILVEMEKEEQCSLCKGEHLIQKCQKFLELTTAGRVSIIREERRCFACLGLNHHVTECTTKERCYIDNCTSYHSRLLHFTRAPANAAKPKSRTAGAKRPREAVPGGMISEHKRPRIGHLKAIMPSPEHSYGSTSATSREGSRSQVNVTTTGTQNFTTTSRDPHKWVRQPPVCTERFEEPDSEQS